MHIAILHFAGFSTIELEKLCRATSKESAFEMKNENRKKSFYASRCAAAILMRSINKKLEIKKDETLGFPYLANEKGEKFDKFFLSLAHTEEVAVAVISHSPVGIDVENISRNAENALPRILSEKEKQFFEKLPAFFQIQKLQIPKSLLFWVLKESAAKATGLGMTKGMDIFEINSVENSLFNISTPQNAPFTFTEAQCCPFIVDNYIFSVCAEKKLLGRGVLGSVLRILDLDGKFEQIY